MTYQKTTNSQLNRLSIENFKSSDKIDIQIVLDNLRSGHNIGSIFRSSDAFLIKKIFICGNSAVPPNKEIIKTALGATETVEWEYFENTLEAIECLKKSGVSVFAIEQAKNSISLENFTIENYPKLALVFGNEVDGVDQSVIDACTGCIEIPQFGTKHSLNVSISSGIVLWHLVNQLIVNIKSKE
jgi:23S rRNA (guanosine2251-2'-O)-methyltransferase